MHGHLTVVRYLLQQELSTERLLGDRKVLLCSYITGGFSDMFNRRGRHLEYRDKVFFYALPRFSFPMIQGGGLSIVSVKQKEYHTVVFFNLL